MLKMAQTDTIFSARCTHLRSGQHLSARFSAIEVFISSACGEGVISSGQDPIGMRIISTEAPMRFEKFSFGSIRIDGTTYDHDIVIDGGQIRKRKKKPSQQFRDAFGHTPLSIKEKIPWKCRQLVIGTGTGALPVMEEVRQEAKCRRIKLLVLPTAEAIEALKENPPETNAILHVTC